MLTKTEAICLPGRRAVAGRKHLTLEMVELQYLTSFALVFLLPCVKLKHLGEGVEGKPQARRTFEGSGGFLQRRVKSPSHDCLHCQERSLAVLVLTRRLRESIVIPGLNVTIRVVAMKGGTVRIGIEAPPDVPIMRGELLEQSEAVAREGRPADTQLCCV